MLQQMVLPVQQKAVIIPELLKNSNTEKQDKWKSWKVLSPPLLATWTLNHPLALLCHFTKEKQFTPPHPISSKPRKPSFFNGLHILSAEFV